MKQVFIILLLLPWLCQSQNSNEKIYVGFEPLLWYKDNAGNPTNIDVENSGKAWFRKYQLKIKNDSIFLDIVPVTKVGGKTFYSASDGGFYYYKGVMIKDYSEMLLELTEITCDYCPVEVSLDRTETIAKRKIFGKIVAGDILINNINLNQVEYSKILLRSEYVREE